MGTSRDIILTLHWNITWRCNIKWHYIQVTLYSRYIGISRDNVLFVTLHSRYIVSEYHVTSCLLYIAFTLHCIGVSRDIVFMLNHIHVTLHRNITQHRNHDTSYSCYILSEYHVISYSRYILPEYHVPSYSFYIVSEYQVTLYSGSIVIMLHWIGILRDIVFTLHRIGITREIGTHAK